MRAAWAAFAATGDPGWAAFTPDEALTRVFDVTSATRPYPHPRSRLLWRDHDFGPLPLPGP
jgi:para-nitrobenzyl esterase